MAAAERKKAHPSRDGQWGALFLAASATRREAARSPPPGGTGLPPRRRRSSGSATRPRFDPKARMQRTDRPAQSYWGTRRPGGSHRLRALALRRSGPARRNGGVAEPPKPAVNLRSHSRTRRVAARRWRFFAGPARAGRELRPVCQHGFWTLLSQFSPTGRAMQNPDLWHRRWLAPKAVEATRPRPVGKRFLAWMVRWRTVRENAFRGVRNAWLSHR